MLNSKLNKTRSIGIISYCDHIRTYAHVNHQFYADKHNYTYIYDIAPTIHTTFKNKIEKILKYIDLFDYIFWIDDDAFFLQYEKRLEDFLLPNRKYDLIFCKSPLNQGKWTYLSSGNFFIKSNKRTRSFLQKCLDTTLEEVKPSWDENIHGMYTHGDQDIMVYLLHNDSQFASDNFHICLDYEQFNTRSFHFKKHSDEHFLVHFTGEHKGQQSLDFAQKFKLSKALIPYEAYDVFNGIYEPIELD